MTRNILRHISCFLLLTAGLMACSEQIDTPKGDDGDGKEENPIVLESLLFTGELEDFSAEGITLAREWDKTDLISILTPAHNGRFSIERILGETGVAAFSGKAEKADEHFALYPYDAEATLSEGRITAVLPATQTAVAEGLPSEGNTAVTYTDKAALKFRNVGTAVGVTVGNDNIAEIRIRTAGAAGKATIDWNNGEPAVSGAEASEVVLTGDFVKGKTYYAVLYNGADKQMQVTFVKKNSSMADKAMETPVQLPRSGIVSLGEISFTEEEFHYEGELEGDQIDRLFIAGAGSEEGQEFVSIYDERYYNTINADYHDIVDPIDGSTYYEIYTRITAGAPYWFRDKTGKLYNAETFEVAADETSAGATVDETAVYRIRIDIAGKKVYRSKVDRVTLFVGMNQSHRTMDYVEKGKWTIPEYNVKWIEASWNNGIEERYRFCVTLDGTAQPMGFNNPEIHRDRPLKITAQEYWYLIPCKTGQWTGMFKYPDWLVDGNSKNRWFADVNLYLNNELGHYTHEFANEFEMPSEGLAFNNPLVTDFSVPDPDVIRGDDGYFYSYSTEHDRSLCRNVPIMKSSDLVHWEKVGTLFTDETHPSITDQNNAGIWAPAIHKVGDKYVCYYSQPGNNYKHAIGVATSDTPWGPFTDHGKLIDSNEQGVDISIDAYLYQEDGRNWLFWGSFRSISVLELTADGLAIKDKETQKRVEVAGGQYEASVVLKRDGWYYLIVSTGDYSKGGTYRIVVGRSKNLLGPYTDKQGRDMMAVHHELVLEGNANFSSPGHCSKLITDDNGQDWILYHAYPNDKNFRCMMIGKINWVDGWPEAPYKQASNGETALPYFKK